MDEWQKNQKGITGIGLMIIFFLIGFFVLLGIRMVPLYLNNVKVANVISGLESIPGLATKSIPEIKQTIDRRFEVDDVQYIEAKNVKFERAERGISVVAEYEARTQIFANIDVVVSFKETVELTTQ